MFYRLEIHGTKFFGDRFEVKQHIWAALTAGVDSSNIMLYKVFHEGRSTPDYLGLKKLLDECRALV